MIKKKISTRNIGRLVVKISFWLGLISFILILLDIFLSIFFLLIGWILCMYSYSHIFGLFFEIESAKIIFISKLKNTMHKRICLIDIDIYRFIVVCMCKFSSLWLIFKLKHARFFLYFCSFSHSLARSFFSSIFIKHLNNHMHFSISFSLFFHLIFLILLKMHFAFINKTFFD